MSKGRRQTLPHTAAPRPQLDPNTQESTVADWAPLCLRARKPVFADTHRHRGCSAESTVSLRTVPYRRSRHRSRTVVSTTRQDRSTDSDRAVRIECSRCSERTVRGVWAHRLERLCPALSRRARHQALRPASSRWCNRASEAKENFARSIVVFASYTTVSPN